MDQQDQIVKHSVENIIQKYANNEGYTEYKILYHNTARNFCSVAKRVTIDGTRNGVPTKECIFIKTLTSSVLRNERLKLTTKFEREMTVYNKIFREFANIQQHLSGNNKFSLIRCIEANKDFILLEDLALMNYKDVSDRKSLDTAHITIMIKELAKFHAMSFALKHHTEMKFKELTKDFIDIFVAAHRIKTVYENSYKYALIAATEENKSWLLQNGPKLVEMGIKSTILNEYAVICHGDYNLRNVLFKYDQERKPIEMAMIDFQLANIGSPVKDIFFMAASSMSTELRESHYPLFVSLYYESLTNHLSLLDCDVNLCYPKQVFMNDFKENFPAAFCNSLVVLRVLCSPKRSDEDMDKIYEKPEGTGSIFEYDSDDAERQYNERINGLIKHYKTEGFYLN